ncbi:MAG: hypothetical protein LBG05_06905 [Treponema sp.]|jgi:hypothetical protein|nr:hypothetical protein [Treponema sp.]
MLVLNDSWAVPPLKNPYLEKSRSASAASVVGFPLEPLPDDGDGFVEDRYVV